MRTRIYYILISFFLFLPVYGQKAGYRIFENIHLNAEASVISCFLQDSQGLIWIGSNKGLFSYDGYSTQPHFTFGEQSNTRIYCGVIVDDTYLYLGADNGILIYNYKTDRYETPDIAFPSDVRTLALNGKELWIGTLNGLYMYDTDTKRLKHFDRKTSPGLPHQTIYSILCASDGNLYIATYNGLCYYAPRTKSFEHIILPDNLHKSNLFVNSLLEDTGRRCIWIGTEGNLFRYSLANGEIELIEAFRNNSIKSLALDNNYLLAGTDNGMYVYHEGEALQHIVHDSRNAQSLSNNIIWNIFTDREKNIWLGTDYGISMSRCNNTFRYVPIAQITGTGEGNHFYSLFKDSKGYYWFGGTNGLIRFNDPAGDKHNAVWYQMGNKRNPLPHNRIRHIYEDKEQQLWIATDGSINRYDYGKQQFVHYTIIDSTGTYNSNWAYHLFEDNQGKLWVATCLGGIFVVDKHKLMQAEGRNYVAERNYSIRNGLSGMFINQIIPDHEGNVWVLLYNNGIDKIDSRTGRITPISIGELTGEMNPNYILCDSSGNIWAGFRGGIVFITPGNNHTQTIRFDEYSNNEILSMMEAEGHIWISTTDGFWVVDKQNMSARRLNLTEKRFTSLFYSKDEKHIYMGGADGFAISSPDVLKGNTLNKPVFLTALYANGQLITPHPDNSRESIRYTNRIELDYKQNNLSFELSDLPYSLEEKNKFVYRMEGVDKAWTLLKANTNRITYNNLDYGNYRLIVSKLDENGNPSEQPYELQIHITPPWYYTPWAKGVYALLILSLVLWAINFFRVKNRLKIERIEKEKILEQSRVKINFFTNLSHDFKTPLSMIIAPVSQLLFEIKNPQEKKQLELVQRNAMKLNALIHQVLDFNRMDSDTSSCLILSKLELISFARGVFSIYQEGTYEGKSLCFDFKTNREKLYIDADAIKLESILTNLLSNAVKYTPDGGNICLSLHYKEETNQMEMSVSDTGIGIPQQDLPYIFQRFFQSSRTAEKKEGTGIGLYLVKTYAELHGGSIGIASELNVGTTITITLPAEKDEQGNGLAIADKVPVASDENRPLVLIVDDNPEITEFISQILQSKYRCQMAENGKQGLDICFKHLPDLIITDEMMPVMNGLEMCQHIKKHTPTSTIPIILLTAKSDKDTELKSMQQNIDAFIAKPFEPDILLSRAEQLLNNKQTLEAKARIETINTPKSIEAVSLDEKFLSDLIKTIEDHISDSDLNVNSLSELSGVSTKQLYRKVKQLTGMTPVEYIKSIRMKKAAMLLSQQKFSVAEVMYMIGFSSHSYFSKCFQAEFGKTPRQYMDNN